MDGEAHNKKNGDRVFTKQLKFVLFVNFVDKKFNIDKIQSKKDGALQHRPFLLLVSAHRLSNL